MKPQQFIPFIFPLAILALVLGIWAGWLRMGWSLPLTAAAGRHGALMVGSFLGSLISLERAVVIKKNWAMWVPLLSAASLIFFLAKLDTVAFYLLLAGSFGQMLIMASFLAKHNHLHFKILFVGSACWFTGNLLWLRTGLYPLAAVWWMAFLFLIITGERLELSQYLPVNKTKRLLLIALLILFVIGVAMPFHMDGRYLSGSALMGAGIWLLLYDMAGKSIKRPGRHRFSGLLLIAGYCWLIICGAIMVFAGMFGLAYDAALHSFFIGFVFSMIFAHSIIILPAVLRFSREIFHPLLFLPAILLHISLVFRIAADLLHYPAVRKWAGMWNGLSILLFIVIMAFLVKRSAAKTSASV